jgi:hypothetical protein
VWALADFDADRDLSLPVLFIEAVAVKAFSDDEPDIAVKNDLFRLGCGGESEKDDQRAKSEHRHTTPSGKSYDLTASANEEPVRKFVWRVKTGDRKT